MQRLYNTSIILLIIISTILLIKQTNIKDPSLFSQNQSQEYMEGVKLYSYDPKGILKNFITSDDWKFSAITNISVIKNPKVIIYKWPEHTYKIIANLGKILHHNNLSYEIKLIQLYSNIHIQQKYLNNNRSGFNLNTSYLEFNPNNEIATTEKPVSIHKPGLIINGIGMQADLKNHQLELYNNVNSKYISNQQELTYE